jgi:hypothetical protein
VTELFLSHTGSPRERSTPLALLPSFLSRSNKFTAAYSALERLHPAYRTYKRLLPSADLDYQRSAAALRLHLARRFFDHTTSRDCGDAGGLLASSCVSWLCRSPSRHRQIVLLFRLGRAPNSITNPKPCPSPTATARTSPRPRAPCMRIAVFWSCGARYPPIRVSL